MTGGLPPVFVETAARLSAGVSWFSRRRAHVFRPHWLTGFDGLYELYEGYGDLLRRGRIEQGLMLMANDALFAPGRQSLPGAVLHSPTASPAAMRRALSRVNELRVGPEQRDPTLERVAKVVRSDLDRSRFVRLPPAIAPGQEIYFSVLMFHPRHLPGRTLSSGWLPIVTHPELDSLMVLPCWMWADDLRRAWADLPLR